MEQVLIENLKAYEAELLGKLEKVRAVLATFGAEPSATPAAAPVAAPAKVSTPVAVAAVSGAPKKAGRGRPKKVTVAEVAVVAPVETAPAAPKVKSGKAAGKKKKSNAGRPAITALSFVENYADASSWPDKIAFVLQDGKPRSTVDILNELMSHDKGINEKHRLILANVCSTLAKKGLLKSKKAGKAALYYV